MISASELLKHLIFKANEQKWYRLIAKWKKFMDFEGHVWGYGQKSLLAHSVATAWTAYRVGGIVGLSEEDMLLALTSGFLHDVGKAREEFQRAAEGGSTQPEDYHHHTPEQVRQDIHFFLVDKNSRLPKDFENKVYDLVMALEVPESPDQIETLMTVSVDRKVLAAVALADELESMKTIEDFKRGRGGQEFKRNLKILGLNVTYHEVGVIRGVITQLLHDALHTAFKENGFYHIMYFPSGTVYIYSEEGEHNLPTLDQVKGTLSGSIRKMVEKVGRKLGRKAYGNLRAAHFNAPEYLYASKDSIHSFWSYIYQSFMPEDFSRLKIKEKTEGELKKREEFQELSDDERVVYAIQLERITRLCILMADIVKHAIEGAGQKKQVMDIVRSAFVEAFSVEDDRFSGILEEMMSMAIQKEELERIEFAYRLVESCDLKDNLKKAAKKLKDLFVDLTEKLAPYARKVYSITNMIVGSIDKILEEVVHPYFGRNLTEIVEEAAEAYQKGKKKGTPVCAFCGREETETAVAGRFGKGAESFHNFLAGGTVITGANKIHVCDVCTLESKLKLLMLENPEQMIILAPQFKLDGYTAKIWLETCYQLAKQWGCASGRGLQGNYLDWARAIIDGEDIQALPEETKIVEILTIDEKRKLKRVIKKMLEAEEGPVLKDIFSEANYDPEDVDTIARDFLNGRLEKRLETVSGGEVAIETIREKAGLVETSVPVFQTPNFMLILLHGSIREGKESDAAAKLRQIFIGALLGKVFQSCVNIVDDVNAVITFPESFGGYLRIPRSAAISHLLSQLGIDPERTGWLAIQRIDTVLRKLSAMLLTEKVLKNYNVSYGENTLLRISKTLPGEVLNRLTQRSRHIKRENLISIINYLNIIEN